MPDERDLLDFQPEEPSRKDEVPTPSQEDTEPLLFMFDEEEHDGTLNDLDVLDEHDQPTMPLPSDTNALSSDPKQTLAGSGGLDPNPDFQQKSQSPKSQSQQPAVPNQNTQPHVVPFEHTLVHVPGESRQYPPQSAQQRPAQTQQAGKYTAGAAVPANRAITLCPAATTDDSRAASRRASELSSAASGVCGWAEWSAFANAAAPPET